MSEVVHEKALRLYSHLLKEALEFRKLIEEKKKEIRLGIFGKGSIEEFKKIQI